MTPSKTLIQRLREYASFRDYKAMPLCTEAADEIERLEARIATLIAEVCHYTAYPGQSSVEAPGYWTEEERQQSITCGAAREMTPKDADTISRALETPPTRPRCPAGLKAFTRCKLPMGHAGDCDYEEL